jgi:hypothetical protein
MPVDADLHRRRLYARCGYQFNKIRAVLPTEILQSASSNLCVLHRRTSQPHHWDYELISAFWSLSVSAEWLANRTGEDAWRQQTVSVVTAGASSFADTSIELLSQRVP